MKRLTAAQVDEILAGVGPAATIWLVGAGGCGMSGLGNLLLDLGCNVRGSDAEESAFLDSLRVRGADVAVGHSAERFREANPALVVYTPAVRADNVEMIAAEQAQVPIVRRSTALAALARRRSAICVTGMHGKSTTSAMLAFALERLGAEPGYAVGATIPQLSEHARFNMAAGDRGLFVVETDESDGSLPEFAPENAIVLNVDEEHLEHFENLERVCAEFNEFGRQVAGALIYCADDPRLSKLYAGRAHAVSYGFNLSANYRVELEPREPGDGTAGTRFRLFHQGECRGRFHTRLLGATSASNAAAVAALLLELGFEARDVAEALGEFEGAGRRQEEIFHDSGIRVFEDYGHHPEEIEVTLDALRTLGGERLLVAFQPHKYTRTRFLLSRFAKSFHAADKVWITDVYPAGEEEIPGVNGEALCAAICEHGERAEFASELGRLAELVRAELREGDVVVFLGAGDICRPARALARQLKEGRMEKKQELLAALQTRLGPGSVARTDEPMAKRTTLRVGGPADFYVEPDSEDSLAATLAFCAEEAIPFRVVGRGSNLLVRDGGFRGMVICLKHESFSAIRVEGDEIHCGAGARLRAVAQAAKQHELGGLEFLEGIPGSVGGALRMNAGAMGGATFDSLVSLRFMSHAGEPAELSSDKIEVGYRSCPMFKDSIALGAVFRGTPTERELIQERMDACSRKRWDSQPAAPSAGCMFKNPDSIPAGRLVEELGLKGMRVGGAMVSDVHGNFVVNAGDAKASDVLELIERVRAKARTDRGIELHTEVEIIGEEA